MARPISTAPLERAPDDPQAIGAMSSDLFSLGRAGEQIGWARRLTEHDPLQSSGWNSLGNAYCFAGRFEEADRAFLRGLEVDPGAEVVLRNRGLCLVRAGHAAEGLQLCLDPTAENGCRAFAYYALGQVAEAERTLDVLRAGATGNRVYFVARIYAAFGKKDEAFAWLERARAEHVRALNSLLASPELRSLHSDPRWEELLREMNLPVAPESSAHP